MHQVTPNIIDDGNAEFVTNTMGAAEMVEVLKAIPAAK